MDILSVPDSERDDLWEKKFLDIFTNLKVKISEDKPKAGIDQWPYLHVETAKLGAEPVAKICDWLSTRGIGLLVNPQKPVPDYIFTYGMIWNFKERGRFVEDRPATPPREFVLNEKTQVMAGAPSDAYLPPYVRSVLKQFFMEQGILMPRILILSEDKKHFDLCLSLDSLGLPPATEHDGIAEAVQWFLPTHYSLVLVREKGLPAFVGL